MEKKESIYPIWRHHKTLESKIVHSEAEDLEAKEEGFVAHMCDLHQVDEAELDQELEDLEKADAEPETEIKKKAAPKKK